MEKLCDPETALISTLWETEGEDKGGTLEVTVYSIFSGSAVFVMFLRSAERILICSWEKNSPVVTPEISAASHPTAEPLSQMPTCTYSQAHRLLLCVCPHIIPKK